MASENLLQQIQIKGMKTANIARFIIGSLSLSIVLSAASQTDFTVMMTLSTGLTVFLIITIVNQVFIKKNIRSTALLYFTIFYEVSLPTLFKASFGVSNNAQLAVNDSTFLTIYFIMILLSLLQNKRRITFFAGTIATIEYTAIILLSIFLWDVPVAVGKEVPLHLILDNEIAKVILIIGFTYIGSIVLRNINGYASRAIENGRIAEERALHLEEIIKSATSMNRELVQVSEDQKVVCTNLSDLSQDQAAMSEEFSSVHEEQYASIESINRSTIGQQRESHESLQLIRTLRESQKKVIELGQAVLEENSRIAASSGETTEKLNTMIRTMEVISEGGKSITDFITVINDITDQINLLSLNAAIEAARAGEHGKGFAVVADEIGKLAAATGDNAREISAQLERITTDIDKGVEIVNTTRSSIDTVTSVIEGINTKVNDVSTAMEEQGNIIHSVEKQAEKLEELSRSIAVATQEQQVSMEETSKSIQKMTTMAQSINESNEDVYKGASTISLKSTELGNLIESVNEGGEENP